MAVVKKIIFTATNDISYDRRMQRICTSLANNGWDVTLIGRELKTSVPLKKFPFKTLRLKCFFNTGKLFYIEYNLRLFWKLLFIKADIYAAVDLDTIIPVFKVAFLKQKKKFFDAHEYFQEVPEVVHRPIVREIWNFTAKVFIPHADLATTVSESLALEFKKKHNIQFHTIRNLPRKSKAPSKEIGKYLLYQGALNVGRGLEQILESMQHVEMPLKIAGEGDISEQLQKKVRALKLENKVEFLGFTAPEKLNELTANAFIGFNLLEEKGLSYYYSLANKFFDYINYGIPSLCIDFPEYRIINKEFEVCVLMKNILPVNIAEHINSLLNDQARYKKLKENCLLAREKFNWETEERKLLELYQRFG